MTGIDRLKAEKAASLEAQALEDEKRRRDYGECFGSPSGRRVLLDFFTRAYFFSTSNTGNAQTYANEGARQFALMIMSTIPGICGEVLASYLAGIEDILSAERMNKRKQD